MTVGGGQRVAGDSATSARSNTTEVISGQRGVRDVDGQETSCPTQGVKMRNHWVTAVFAILIWGIIVIMNIALLVLVGLGCGLERFFEIPRLGWAYLGLTLLVP